jgi:hypothetical protein
LDKGRQDVLAVLHILGCIQPQMPGRHDQILLPGQTAQTGRASSRFKGFFQDSGMPGTAHPVAEHSGKGELGIKAGIALHQGGH